ncbi:MAG: sodium-dependent transporter [Clostridia bacterium]|nr:sodium-dependent transporter [Clostridia bacterium]
MEREKFGSRLGFILISAGCAIGIGNVWRFPYVAGNNGGGIFVLLYMLFLLLFGIPILAMELSVGRASKCSIIRAYNKLEKPGSKWHIHGYLGMLGNYMLMFFYTTVSGWMLGYFIKYVTGSINETTDSKQLFADVTASPLTMFIWMAVIVIIAIVVCSMGLQNGVEKVTKYMMLALLALIVILAVHSLTLSGASRGMKYFLVPDMDRIRETGFANIVIEAMRQAFFTLSIGMGSMMIFGSYIGKERALTGESIQITILDTFVAIMSGVIIFPACMSYNIPTDSGPSLIFVTLPKVFEHMPGGRFWGAMFFLFMTFSALSTVIAVLENILACNMEAFSWSRKKACLINLFVIIVMSIPCILGFNVLSGFTPFGAGSNVLDLEDFIVSSIILPVGSLIILLFCTSKWGWGFDNFMEEVNTGKGIRMPKALKIYLKYLLPVVIIFLIVDGLI